MPHAEFLIIHNMWKTTNIYRFIMWDSKHCVNANVLLVKYLVHNFLESWKNVNICNTFIAQNVFPTKTLKILKSQSIDTFYKIKDKQYNTNK